MCTCALLQSSVCAVHSLLWLASAYFGVTSSVHFYDISKMQLCAHICARMHTCRPQFVRCTPSKGWLLPMGVTSSGVSENGKMLAFGMDDGTVLVWDDHFGALSPVLI